MSGWDDLVAEGIAAIEGSPRARARKSGSFIDQSLELRGDELNGGRRSETDKAVELDDSDLRVALAVIEDVCGATAVIAITDRPSYRGYLLDAELGDLHTAIDRLERETCRGAARCQAGHRCRRHTRRPKA